MIKRTTKQSSGSRRASITGIITTTRGGLGFLPSDKFDEDVRIEEGDLNTALNGDTVEVKLHKSKPSKPNRPFGGRTANRQPSGEVVRVIKRAKTRFVGVIKYEGGSCFLIPDDNKIYTDILISKPDNLKDNQKALIELVKWEDPSRKPLGKVIKTLGSKGDHETEIASIVLERGIDTTFPDIVEREAQNIERKWKQAGNSYIASAVDHRERKDFRKVPTFTIDPTDAKDFDDALSIRRIKNPKSETRDSKLWEVGVHIADVSHYVRPGSPLDREAKQRGFSVYLVDRTIPMLPEALSNNLCSLNPETDRLTFSSTFELDSDGNIKKRWFGLGVIHSRKRFDYQEAQKVIETKSGVFSNELTTLNTLAKTLRDKRFAHGAIDFEQDEVEIEIDERGVPVRIYKKKRLDSHKLIEEFMLLANKEVAQEIFRAHGKKDIERGFIYRVHDLPEQEKLEEVALLVKTLGYSLNTNNIEPRDINRLFKNINGKPVANLIKTAMIRSMAKAAYATKNIGHFGLGFKYYTHFTSPIRRYSDLLVHRLLAKHLRSEDLPASETKYYRELAKALSEKEITVQGAERDSIKYKQVEYMASRIGQTFDGVINGVTEWGVYVTESTTNAEGLVRMRDLSDDFYTFDDRRFRLVGKKNKKKYTLGDIVKIKVVSADVDRKTLDFVFV